MTKDTVCGIVLAEGKAPEKYGYEVTACHFCGRAAGRGSKGTRRGF